MTNLKGYEENLYTQYSIRTSSGIYVDFVNPRKEMFCIEDIAHALSQLPRFGGHLPYWYSVADHCISCARKAEQDGETKGNIFACLMHDCSEAYLLDLPSPIKKLIPGYIVIEDRILRLLSEIFGFHYGLDGFGSYVKSVDKYKLEVEWDYFIGLHTQDYIRNPKTSEKIFLEAYEKYRH